MLADVKARSSVDYMLRTAQQNQMALATLADQKANIVLGMTFLSVTLSASKLTQGAFPLPLELLLVSAVMAGMFALGALIPRSSVTHHRLDKEGLKTTLNPLFFGGIASVDYPCYLEHMADLLRTDAGVYQAIIADIYSGARALQRKYQWLRYSYIALMTGLVISGSVALLQYLGAVPV